MLKSYLRIKKNRSIRLTPNVIEPMERRVLLSGTVGGTVFNDPSQTGVLSSNAGIADRQIYVDLSGDNTLEAGDPTAVTDSNGNYTIANVPSGTYAVRQILPPGFGQTSPVNFDQLVTISDSSTVTQNFGDLTLTSSGIGTSTSGSQTLNGLTATTKSATTEPDGKLLVVGSGGTVARFFPDGTPDKLFGNNGIADVPSTAANMTVVGLVVQPDGQIDVAATAVVTSGLISASGASYQLNPDGSVVDTSVHIFDGTPFDTGTLVFSGTGYSPDDNNPYDVELQNIALLPSGDVVVTGDAISENIYGNDPYYSFATELNPATGQPITSLGGTGTVGRSFAPDPSDGYQPNAVAVANSVGGFNVLFYSYIQSGGFQEFGSNGPFVLEGFGTDNTQSFLQADVTTLDQQKINGTLCMAASDNGELTISGQGFDSVGTFEFDADRFSAIDGTLETSYGLGGIATAPIDLGANRAAQAVSPSASQMLPDGEVLVTCSITTMTTVDDGNGDDLKDEVYVAEFDSTGAAGNGTINLGAAGSNTPSFNNISGLVSRITSASSAVERAGSISPRFVNGSVGFTNTYHPQPGVIFGSAADNLNVESTAPAAIWQTPTVPTITIPGSTLPEELQVEFKDHLAINPQTLGAGNLQVTFPNGIKQMLSYLGVQKTGNQPDKTGNNQDLYADYSLAAPGGGWTLANNGTYAVALLANQVSNGAHAAPAATLGTFAVAIVDTTVTSVLAAVPAVTESGMTPVALTITYTGASAAIAASSIDVGDLTVTGPAGSSLPIASAAAGTASGNSLPVTYTVSPPAGGWVAAENGAYTVLLNAGQVTDVSSDSAAASTLGTITVAIGTVSTGGTTASSVTLTPSASSAKTGNLVSFTATVVGANGGTPTGTITFLKGAALLSSVSLTNGTATFGTSSLPVGSAVISAVYLGDASYATSTSLNQTITITGPSAGAGVLIPSLSTVVLPPNLVAGAKRKLSVPISISNAGQGVASGLVKINLYVSTDGELDASATLITTITRKVKLKFGKSAKLVIHLAGLPVSLAAGDYHLLAQVIDSSGFGQFAATDSAIAIAKPVIVPTIAFAKVTLPGLLVAGKNNRGTVTLDLANDGNVAMTGAVTVELRLTSDGTADGNLIKIVVSKVNIPPGKSTKISITPGRLPALGPGAYQLAAIAKTPASNGAAAVTVTVVDPPTIQLQAANG